MKRLPVIFFFLSLITNAQQPFALVELFTSDGCLSCPPADDLLNKIKADAVKTGKNIYALEFHVDYWNHLGWKDPYSKFQYTTRQENYSRVLAEKEVYTPEAVINGSVSFTGSKKELMNENIRQALSKQAAMSLSISKDSLKNDTLYISFTISKSNPDYVLRLALTEDDLAINVDKGENAGKSFIHDNIVREFYSFDKPSLNGQAKIPANVFSGNGNRRLVVFIQDKKSMHVLGIKEMVLNNKE